jgi:putative solute:sodium symporter small subunit
LTILLNALANIIPFNSVTTGEVADNFLNYFTPMGYVFAIWGAIYVLLLIFVFYQIRANQVNEEYLGKIGFLYLIGAILNVTWLLVFHYSYGNDALLVWTEPLIVGLLVVLLITYVRLEIGVKEVPLKQKIAVHLPVSVYVGWISLATIANTASVLVTYFVIPLEVQYLWTALVLIIALLITSLMIILRRDIAYALVVIWAAPGIAAKWTMIPIIYWSATLVTVIVILLIIVVPLLRKKNPIDYYLVRHLE